MLSSAASWAWVASVFQVLQVSPVKWMAERWSAHGPAAYEPAVEICSDAPIRASTKPRWPELIRSCAYRWLIQLSGVTPGMDTLLASQHQSRHQKATP